jgi:hypothetical protein
MPRATVNLQETERHELKTLNEGYVVLRRLSYGEKLHRRAMVSNMKISSNTKSSDFAGEMQLVNEAATRFDFQTCIVEHNLEDENGTVLDFKKLSDIQKLDPRIGEEIDTLINDMNNFEMEDDVKN